MLNDMVLALEAALERLKEREEEAAAAAAAALNRHLETQASLESVQDEIQKTRAAIATMRGETPVPQVAKTADSNTDVAPASDPEPAPEPGVYSDGTPHKKARKRTGIYAGIECTGCGEVGSLYEEMKQLGNGRVLRFLTCNSCKSSRPV